MEIMRDTTSSAHKFTTIAIIVGLGVMVLGVILGIAFNWEIARIVSKIIAVGITITASGMFTYYITYSMYCRSIENREEFCITNKLSSIIMISVMASSILLILTTVLI